LTLNNNELDIEAYARDHLDFEWETVYEFRILANCSSALWTRLVRIERVDLNDNQPKFLNPIGNGQIFYIDINSFTYLYFLIQIKDNYDVFWNFGIRFYHFLFFELKAQDATYEYSTVRYLITTM